jgi:ketosteroid isomerase-like protein
MHPEVRRLLSQLHNRGELTLDELTELRHRLQDDESLTQLDERAANKELVVRYMKYAHHYEWEQLAGCVAEDVVRYRPRPSAPWGLVTRGRDNLVKEFRAHTDIYQAGTLTIEIENILAEGPFVSVQYVQRAVTAKGEPYENYYHPLFQCSNGLVVKCWEYVDTLYSSRTLFDQQFGNSTASHPVRGFSDT